MDEVMISGYMAYTSADELSAEAVADAPASPILISITVISAGTVSASAGASTYETIHHGC